jgi:hypothetical protein
MEGSDTYLEEFISSVELLPNNIRRDFELVRELDREAFELEKEVNLLEQAYLERVRIRKVEGKVVIMPNLTPLLNVHESHANINVDQNQGGNQNYNSNQIINNNNNNNNNLSSPPGTASKANKTTDAGGENVKGVVGGMNSINNNTVKNVNSELGSPKAVGSQEQASDPEGALLLENIASIRTRIRARLRQKTAIATNMTHTIKGIQTKLNSDLAFFETSLRSCGDFEKASGAMPGTDVAIRPSQQSEEMILGKVIVYYADIGAYDVADVDNSKRYHLPESLVTVLDMVEITNKRLSKGEVVYAVYPETTAFYLASVAQAPRRAAAGVEPNVQVQFQGDSDADGTTPIRNVLLRHVFRAFT